MSNVTIFKDAFTAEPFFITVDQALERIKKGKSKIRVEQIRNTIDKEKQDSLKRLLPSVLFSGEFTGRQDANLQKHSGFLVLDFDYVEDISNKMGELSSLPFIYAAWISPRGQGIKALAKIADGSKHRDHFAALKELLPDADKSGVNEARVCFESYDENIYINKKATAFTELKVVEYVNEKVQVTEDSDVFAKLLIWLNNRKDSYTKGERNLYIYKLASACCRFGIHEQSAVNLILSEYPPSNDFKQSECVKAIRSGYKGNRGLYGSANFEKDKLVEKTTKQEVVIDASYFEDNVKPKDVIYGSDVKTAAMDIYKNGYPFVDPIGVPALDQLFKMKRGETTLLTGIGNYGKSAFFKWYQLMRAIKFGEKVACFTPEEYPPQEYYHDFAEMLLGCDCSAHNPNRPPVDVYSNAYDFASQHVFFVYPKDDTPTPDYIKERFLELIIKEKIDGVLIDPFNQLTHNYASVNGRDDKYLEVVLSGLTRFAQNNNIFMPIIAHPNKLVKQADGNYPCPDVFDIAGGAMWNNKMDNITVYHRPFMQSDPDNPTVEFHSKKIRKQKSVGKKGFTVFEYQRRTRRFVFDGIDFMQKLLNEKGYSFKKEQADIKFEKPRIIDYTSDDFSEGFTENNEIA